MLCPACQQPLTESEVDTTDAQKALIYECYNCGGHFVPPLITNLLAEHTVKDLDAISPKNLFSVSSYPICPVCRSTMTSLHDDAVPQGVTVYVCPENHGHFFPLHQFISFKQAQKAKLEYHKLWGIPLQSAFAVLLPVIAIFTAVSVIPVAVNQLKVTQESRVKAGDIISKPLVTPISGNQVVISFTSNTQAITSLILTTPNGPVDYPGTNSPALTHVFTVTDLIPGTPYSYTIKVGNIITPTYYFTTPTQ